MISLSASDIAISVQNVSITYRTTLERVPTFKQALAKAGRGQRRIKEVHALQNISFDIAHGSTLGIIGHNGAGKSTLMRAMAGILPPTQGRIEVHGRVSTLLALGVGFNPALSGRENVILGGLAAGMRRSEVDAKYEEISAFAELDDFMDAPMRTYSSGMYSRLAFAVAVHMDPDILLIDEALSTGDAKFKAKAQAKMLELTKKSSTMVLVSHALGTVRDMCDEVLWLDHGKFMMRGEPEKVVEAYTKFLEVGLTPEVLEDL